MKRGLLYLFALACILGFVRLGFWQLHRAEYKEALLAHSRQILDQRHAEPLAVLADATKTVGDGNQYTWADGSGHFLPLPAVRLDNQDRGGKPGVRIYRAFQPDGAKHAVLVDLGWRQLPPNRALPPEPAPAGNWRLQGLFAPPPASGLQLLFAGNAIQRQPDGSLLLMRLDPARVATTLGLANGLAPRVLRLDPALALGYARDLDVLSGTMPPERHRGYAVQWFGMALALLIITIVVSRRKRP
ncbi:MAG: SURF1 family protein [Lysobacteraceae bacterium]